MQGEEVLISDLLQTADRIYGIPGYPVTGLVSKTNAILVPNEKVALEYALGDSLYGRRAAVIVKHVGLNALADPMVNATYQGLINGVVIIAGDDPTAKNSTVIENPSAYGAVAAVPVIAWSPGDGSLNTAFESSENYSRVAILTVNPDDLSRDIPVPKDTVHFAVPNPKQKHGHGRLAPSDCSMFGRCALAAAMNQSISERGMMPEGCRYPAPKDTGQDHSRKKRGYNTTLCRECPFGLLFEILQNQEGQVICDTGCSLFAMNPPYRFGYASYGMGSAVAVAATSTGTALIGDYGILHSGLPALIDVYEKKLPLLCIIMQNRCMGMTGGQPVFDLLPYIRFADPVIIPADDNNALENIFSIKQRPCTVVVQGVCPEVIHHETYAY